MRRGFMGHAVKWVECRAESGPTNEVSRTQRHCAARRILDMGAARRDAVAGPLDHGVMPYWAARLLAGNGQERIGIGSGDIQERSRGSARLLAPLLPPLKSAYRYTE